MAETIVTKEVSAQELNELLGNPGSESILLQEEAKPSFFSKDGVDMSFLTKKEVLNPPKTEPKKEEGKEEKPDTSIQELKDILTEVDPIQKTEETEETKGRPKVVKDAAIELTRKLIEKGTLAPFDDDKKLEDYTTADFEELIEANLRDKEEQIKQKTPIEFFDSLPQELQYAAKYVADGGTDLKGLFRALAQVEEVRGLSEDIPEDQETIAREYLTVTNFGTPEDIQEEIDSWKDSKKLADKAEKFKPRLEKMRAEQISHKINTEDKLRKQREAAAAQYQTSIYDTLKSGEVNGIKLDKKVQGSLYSGLTQAQYPSISGRATNLLGHLLEKYQFVEPNHALVAEVTWLLSDPEGYRSKVREQAKNETTEGIVRKLKTEETKKIASSSASDKEDDRGQRKIPRSTNFFKR